MNPIDLSRLEGKIDQTLVRLADIEVTGATQTEQLAEHMRRTELLEVSYGELRAEMKPLTRAHFMWSGAGKVMAMAGTLAGGVFEILKLLGKI